MGGACNLKKDKEKKKKRERQADSERAPLEAAFASEERAAEPLLEDYAGSMDFLRQALADLGGKWRLQVLWSLREGNGMRYGSIKSAIPGITDMMLSQSLRELCQSGLTERRQYQEIPPRVEYRILKDGASLIPVIQWLIQWQQNRETAPTETT